MTRRPSGCVEIEPDLLASAVGEAEPAAKERVDAHIGRCGPCRDEFARYRVIDGEVVAMRDHLLAADHVAVSRERLEARLTDLRSRLVAYHVFPSPFGDILIARSEQGVMLVEYLGRAKSVKASRLRRLGAPTADWCHSSLRSSTSSTSTRRVRPSGSTYDQFLWRSRIAS